MLQEPHAAVGADTTPASSGRGRESCTALEVEVGDSKQWRQSAFGADGRYTRIQSQSAFGDDGEYTRLQGHQATGVLQTVRGEAGSITRRAGG